MAVRIEWVTDRRRFVEIASPWDALAAHDGTPFARHAWYAAWWDAFGSGRELAIATVWDGATLVAALPCCDGTGTREALANVHTPFFRPLARDDAAVAALV